MIIRKKRIAFPGSYYDTIRFEKWLSQRAAEGLRFVCFSSSGKIPVFRKEEPRRVRYYVEPDFDQYTPEEAEKAYQELGWTYVEELRGTCLVYETEEVTAVKPQRRFEEKEWEKKWRNLWLGQLALVPLTVLSVYLLLRPFLQSISGEGRSIVAVLLLATVVMVIYQIWPMAANLYDIHVWNRCMRLSEEPDEWRGIVFLRWGEVVLLWLMILMIPVAWFIYSL